MQWLRCSDMGISAWGYSNSSRQPFQARPLPLFNNTVIVEQPTNLATISRRYVDAALGYITEAVDAKTPFLLYMPWNHVHNPNFASVDFCNTSVRGPVGDATQELDHAVGALLQGVGAMAGVDENTIWFFTSDNGAPLGNDRIGNGPLRDGKFTTWEGGIREPAAIRWKGTIKPGRTDELAATYDIFATIAAMAGVAPPPAVVLDGADLSGLLLHGAKSPHRCLVHYHSPQNKLSNTSGVAAVRCGQYKAHFFTHSTANQSILGHYLPAPDGEHDPPLLFDLDEDGSPQTCLEPAAHLPRICIAIRTRTCLAAAHLRTADANSSNACWLSSRRVHPARSRGTSRC